MRDTEDPTSERFSRLRTVTGRCPATSRSATRSARAPVPPTPPLSGAGADAAAAAHCALTHTPGRAAFEQRLQALLYEDFHARAVGPGGTSHVLALLDIDQFRLVNHRLGRGAGDELLYQVAELLSEHVIPDGFIARTGGDEFAILFENHSLAQARHRCRYAMHAVAAHRFDWEGRSVRLTVSAGLVGITAGADHAVSELLSEADHARRAAAREGRGGLHCTRAGRTARPAHPSPLSLAAELANALEADALALYRQPIVARGEGQHAAATGPGEAAAAAPRRYELLLRLRRGDRMIGPRPLLKAAEQHHLVSDVDRWVIERAVAWLARRPAAQTRRELCCINLSARSLRDRAFVAELRHLLRPLGDRASSICFEIGEAAVDDVPARTRAAMQRLAALGCSFALQDLGGGHAARLPHLQALPLRYVKIDGRLIREARAGGHAARLLELINQIAQSAGKATVAQHVEDAATFALIEDIGIDYAQGWYLGTPRPIAPAEDAARAPASATLLHLPLPPRRP